MITEVTEMLADGMLPKNIHCPYHDHCSCTGAIGTTKRLQPHCRKSCAMSHLFETAKVSPETTLRNMNLKSRSKVVELI